MHTLLPEFQCLGCDDGGVEEVEAEGIGAVSIQDQVGFGVIEALAHLLPSAARTRPLTIRFLKGALPKRCEPRTSKV